MIADAERMSLLGRGAGDHRARLRYHPLVREFLETRLRSAYGAKAVSDLHRQVAVEAGTGDWIVAAHHFREAGDSAAVLRTMDAALPTIMANAQYALAESLISDVPRERREPFSRLVRGRVDLQEGDYVSAARGAQEVLDACESDSIQRDHALLNLLAVSFNFGHGERALQLATELREGTTDANLRSIAEASIAIMQADSEHDLDEINRKLRSMARHQRPSQTHHFGVSMYNLAVNSLVQDRLVDAEREVEEALRAFSETASVVERQAASVHRVSILLRRGRHEEAEEEIRALIRGTPPLKNDALLESADAFDCFGNRQIADELLDMVGHSSVQTLVDQRLNALTRARMLLRRGAFEAAAECLSRYPDGVSTMVGMSVARSVLAGQIAVARGRPEGRALLVEAAARAAVGGIHGSRRLAELLLAANEGPTALQLSLRVIGETSPWHLTEVAEVLVREFEHLEADAGSLLTTAALLHPSRWRTVLREALANPISASLGKATLLEEIGEAADVRRLRDFAKTMRRDRRAALLGRTLARRLADRVFVEDQGRVAILVGQRTVAGSSIRRKVLALLCYLITKPAASATRDQVLDALWPDLDPEVAVNSLNQTLYFLRRVFEEDYVEDLSPGYVHSQLRRDLARRRACDQQER